MLPEELTQELGELAIVFDEKGLHHPIRDDNPSCAAGPQQRSLGGFPDGVTATRRGIIRPRIHLVVRVRDGVPARPARTSPAAPSSGRPGSFGASGCTPSLCPARPSL